MPVPVFFPQKRLSAVLTSQASGLGRHVPPGLVRLESLCRTDDTLKLGGQKKTNA